MSTIIAQVEIQIEASQSQASHFRGIVEQTSGSFRVALSGSNEETIQFQISEEFAALDLLRELIRRRLDGFDPNTVSIHVVKDSAALLRRTTYRCPVPTCRTKLYESWGLVYGVTIICRKCKTRSNPVPEV